MSFTCGFIRFIFFSKSLRISVKPAIAAAELMKNLNFYRKKWVAEVQFLQIPCIPHRRYMSIAFWCKMVPYCLESFLIVIVISGIHFNFCI